MEFPFKYSTRILTRSLRSFVLYKVEHEKINLKPTSHHVLLYLLYQHTNNDVFSLYEDSPNFFRMPQELFPELLKIPRKIRRCFDHTPTKLTTIKGSKMISTITSSISSQWYRNFTRVQCRSFSGMEIHITKTFQTILRLYDSKFVFGLHSNN